MKITQEAEKVVDGLCLMDDTLFRVVAQDKEFCEEVLRVILQKEDLEVITVQVQKDLHHIHSHSVVLDVLCKDSHNKNYNIEVQQEDNGVCVIMRQALIQKCWKRVKNMPICRIYVLYIFQVLTFSKKGRLHIM